MTSRVIPHGTKPSGHAEGHVRPYEDIRLVYSFNGNSQSGNLVRQRPVGRLDKLAQNADGVKDVLCTHQTHHLVSIQKCVYHKLEYWPTTQTRPRRPPSVRRTARRQYIPQGNEEGSRALELIGGYVVPCLVHGNLILARSMVCTLHLAGSPSSPRFITSTAGWSKQTGS